MCCWSNWRQPHHPHFSIQLPENLCQVSSRQQQQCPQWFVTSRTQTALAHTARLLIKSLLIGFREGFPSVLALQILINSCWARTQQIYLTMSEVLRSRIYLRHPRTRRRPEKNRRTSLHAQKKPFSRCQVHKRLFPSVSLHGREVPSTACLSWLSLRAHLAVWFSQVFKWP